MENFQVLAINRHRMKTDGKGITTLVALAGCPLSCRYCINAELLEHRKPVEEITPQELVERLAIDHCYFIYTKGGVTFGGGEPLLHSPQIAAFAELCPKEWNITIETSLNVPQELLEPLLNERFSFIIDIKAMQPEIYQRYTGKGNQQVLCNLKKLAARISTEQYVVKLPQIPGYSDKKAVTDSKKSLGQLGVPADNVQVFEYLTAGSVTEDV